MIPVQEHRERILSSLTRMPTVEAGLFDALGCVLAQDVESRVALPSFDNSAMDGYAVRQVDVAGASAAEPVRLTVEGDIAAGDRRPHTLAPERAFRIMTGAPVPVGADTIVPVELTDGDAVRVRIDEAPPAGQFVRRRAEDVEVDEVVLHEGTRLGPRQLAIASAVGVGTVTVYPKPRVVVVSTGDELVEPGTVPSFGEVVDSNGLMIAAAVLELGAEAYRVSGVRDNPEEVQRVLRAQLTRADAIITIGGVSMGIFDAVKSALRGLGTVEFGKVAMHPGSPQGFGTLGRRKVPLFTLPGNPVSSLVSFEVFVAPALRLLAGRPVDEVPALTATSLSSWSSPAGKTQYARVRLERARTGYSATLVGAQGSHILGGLSEANALAIVPADVTEVRTGDALTCHPLGPIGSWDVAAVAGPTPSPS